MCGLSCVHLRNVQRRFFFPSHCWLSQWTKWKLYPFGLTKMRIQRNLRRSNSKWPFAKRSPDSNATSWCQICPAKKTTLGWETFFHSINWTTSKNSWNLSSLHLINLCTCKMSVVFWWIVSDTFGLFAGETPIHLPSSTSPNEFLTDEFLQIPNN